VAKSSRDVGHAESTARSHRALGGAETSARRGRTVGSCAHASGGVSMLNAKPWIATLRET